MACWMLVAAVAGYGYRLQYRDSLMAGGWLLLEAVPALVTNGIVTVTDAASSGTRFYRVATP